MGEHDVRNATGNILARKEIAVKQAIIHEAYDPLKNDIAILELTEEVDLTEYTPACMARSDDGTFEDKKAWAYGESIIIPF